MSRPTVQAALWRPKLVRVGHTGLALGLLVAACTTSEPAPLPAFTGYSNPPMGFAVQYPVGWVVKEDGNVVLFDSGDDTGAHVRVRVETATASELETAKSEELYRLRLFQTTGAFVSPESVPVEPVVVGGLPGRRTSYVTRNVIVNRFFHETVLEVFAEDRQCSMKLGVLEDHFEQVKDIFAEMMDSIACTAREE